MSTRLLRITAAIFFVIAPSTVFAITTIMPLGDSITRGFLGNDPDVGSYRQYLADQLHGLGVEFDLVGNYNLELGGIRDADYQAVGGFSIGQMVSQFGVAIEQHQPDVILALAGTNDIWSNVGHDEFVSRYDSLVSLVLNESPSSRIIMATVPPLGCCQLDKAFWTEEWAEDRNSQQVAAMNSALQVIAKQYDAVTLADYNSVFDVEFDLTDDGVHPNGAGQRKLGQTFLRTLGDPSLGLFGDTNIDHLSALVAAGNSGSVGDLNADGAVDPDDRDYLIRDVLGSVYGDSNLDGRFDTDDLVQVFKAAEYEDAVAGNSGWAEGDWNGDGDFGTSDLILAYRFSVASTPNPLVVPETGLASIHLLTSGLYAAFIIVQRRQHDV